MPANPPSLGDQGGDATTVWIPCRRLAAVGRGAWRLAIGLVLLPVGLAAAVRANWPVIWATDRASAVALTGLIAAAGLLGTSTVVAAARWFLLAAWPGRVGVGVGPDELLIQGGPFGRHRLDWARASIVVAECPVEEMPPTADYDEVLPSIRHPDSPGEVLETILRLTGAPPKDVMQALAPRLHGVHRTG